jgi:hypothetical protein
MRPFIATYFLLAVLTVSVTSHAQSSSVQILVGGRMIVLPTPPGFFDASDIPGLRQYAEGPIVKQGNRLVAFFLPEEAHQELAQGAIVPFKRWIQIQAHPPLERLTVTKEMCPQMVKSVRAQHIEMFESVQNNPRFNKMILEGNEDDLPNIEVNVGEVIPRGIFAEGTNFITVGILMNGSAGVQGQEPSAGTMAMMVEGTSTWICAKERVFFIYVYTHRRSQDDLNWVRAFTQNWVKDILSANR